MKFMLPIGGAIDERFPGILTSYKHRGIPYGIKAGRPWADDNCAFGSEPFDPKAFMAWLKQLEPYRANCMFIVVPDQVADAYATLQLWNEWYPRLDDWPLALVAQDGMENLEWPTRLDITDYAYDNLAGDTDWDYWEMSEQFWREETPFCCLFIGGSTKWKDGADAIDMIQAAQKLGKHIHIGRVNHETRYRHFAMLPGSEEWTCDGTLTRKVGRHRALHTWAGLQDNLDNYRSQLALL